MCVEISSIPKLLQSECKQSNKNIKLLCLFVRLYKCASFLFAGQVGGYYSPYTGGFTAAQMAAAAAAAAAQQTTQVSQIVFI